jgi:serralysin
MHYLLVSITNWDRGTLNCSFVAEQVVSCAEHLFQLVATSHQSTRIDTMADFALSAFSSVARTLANGESGFIDQGGSLAVTGADAITGTDGTNYITVLGSAYAYGGGFAAIDANGTRVELRVGKDGYIGAASSDTIDWDLTSGYMVDNAGTIQSGANAFNILGSGGANISGYINNSGSIGADSSALQINNNDGTFHLSNSGLISSQGEAVDVDAGLMTIHNTGTIMSSDDGIYLGSSSSIRIHNSGTVSADNAAIEINSAVGTTTVYNSGTLSGSNAIQFDSTVDTTVVNTGTMFGDVNLGGGVDNYDGRLGIHNGFSATGKGRVFGEASNDVLFGGMSEEDIDGGADNDFISGGGGRDDIDGGSGIDIAYYGFSSTGVNVNLATGEGQGGEAEGDQLINVENLIGSAFNDILAGNSAVNSFIGSGGADQFFGYGGNDKFDGGTGGDTFNGGDGVDEVTYVSSFAAVSINLTSQSYGGGDATGDVLNSIETVSGSIYNDTLTGSLGTDRLYGGAGNDTIKAFRGNDFIRGDAGADNIFFIAGDGVDTLFDFENDIDTITFQGLGNNAAVFAVASQVDAGNDGDALVDDVLFNFGANGIFIVHNTTIAELSNDVVTI